MEVTIYYIIIGLLVFDYLLSLFLDYLNTTQWSNTVPAELSGIYDADKYRRSQEYDRDNLKLSLIKNTVSLLIILLVLHCKGFAFLDNVLREYTANNIVLALLFFGILMIISDLLFLPFSLYDTFVIEQRYGFNTTTVATFMGDKLKGWLLSIIIGGTLLSLVMWVYQTWNNNFWIIAWGIIAVFSVFFTMFYSSLIVPLFNKQRPLEPGALRDAIESFAKQTQFTLDNIYIIDGSKRSRKANAYFSGLGAKKRIVLYDTLINDLSTEEIVAVLAHEIGHYKKKHTVTGVISNLLQIGLSLYILSLFIDNPLLSKALGAEQPSFHLGLITFALLYSPVSLITGLGMNILSRRHEYEADRYAGQHCKAQALIDALIKLSVKNLSNLRPHPAYVFFYYSHPTLLQRINKLKNMGP